MEELDRPADCSGPHTDQPPRPSRRAFLPQRRWIRVQRTHVQAEQDDTTGHDSTPLLGLKGLTVARVELTDEGAPVVHVLTDEESAAGWPSCGVLSTSVKGHAVTRPRDVPCGQAPLHLVGHKRRWRCREAACPRGSFTESLPAAPAGARVASRLRTEPGPGVSLRR